MLRKIGISVARHLKLVILLFKDRRVPLMSKLFILAMGGIYVAIPFDFIPDMVPIVGFVDDLALVIVLSFVFTWICPYTVVTAIRHRLEGGSPDGDTFIESFRSQDEDIGLAITLTLLVGTLVVGGYAAGLALASMLAVARLTSSIENGRLHANAALVTEEVYGEVWQVFQAARSRLPAAQIDLFVAQSPSMSAYAFGMQAPYSIVLHSALVNILSPDELKAVIAHEIAHIVLWHTTLFSLIGMYRSDSLARLFTLSWNRACEYNADRMAVMACERNPQPMTHALVKLATGLSSDEEIQAYINQLLTSSRVGNVVAEPFQSHPYLISRIRALIMPAAK